MSPTEPTYSTMPPGEPAPALDRSTRQKRSTTRFWIALIAGLCLVGLLAFILLPAFARINVDRGRPNTQNNMKVMGLVFKMYANESAGNRWPDIADNERIWAPDLSVLYPEFLQDPSVLVASEHPDAEHIRETLRAVLEGPNPDYETAEGLMALSFAYLGHVVKVETEFEHLVEARQSDLLGGPEYVLTLPDGGRVLPFREGVDRMLNADLMVRGASEKLMQDVPVLVETWQWKQRASQHTFTGASILYWDGHVAWVPLGTFPVVHSVMDALCGLAPGIDSSGPQ